MRREFEMTEADMNTLLEAMRPVPYIIVGGVGPRSPQERANDAWEQLGRRLGFDHMTAQPIPGKDSRFFVAEPIELVPTGVATLDPSDVELGPVVGTE